MKIDLKKLSKERKEFSIEVSEGEDFAHFSGHFYFDTPFLVVEGRIKGKIEVICDLSGEKFFDELDEEVKIKVVDGSYKGFDEVYDIIEVEGGVFEVESFVRDEMELFRNDYHKKDGESTQEFIIENL